MQWRVFKIVFWQRKDNRVWNHVVFLTPVKWRSQEASFPDDKKLKKSFPEINALTFNMAAGDVIETIDLHYSTNAWKFLGKNSLLERLNSFSLLHLPTTWRSNYWMTHFAPKKASTDAIFLFESLPETDGNCRKILPIFSPYSNRICVLNRLKLPDIKVETKGLVYITILHSLTTPQLCGNWKLKAKWCLYTYQERERFWDFNKPLHSGIGLSLAFSSICKVFTTTPVTAKNGTRCGSLNLFH